MFTVAAWAESIDPGGALVPIAAVADDTVITQGDQIRVPSGLANVMAQAAMIQDASAVRAQLQSPSLRAQFNLDIEPLVISNVFGSPPEILWHMMNPIPVVAQESLEIHMQSDPAAPARHIGLVYFGDGPQQPVTGNIFSIRATATIQQVDLTWTDGELTFSQVLPFGDYQVVGMRARSTDAAAARLIFRGSPWRPGVPVVNALADRDLFQLRYGRSGVFGTFNTNTPPALEILSGIVAIQTVILDLMRIG